MNRVCKRALVPEKAHGEVHNECCLKSTREVETRSLPATTPGYERLIAKVLRPERNHTDVVSDLSSIDHGQKFVGSMVQKSFLHRLAIGALLKLSGLEAVLN